MTDSTIRSVTMPKWGLSMKEGKVVEWLVEAGATVQPGDQLMEVETDKITSAVEASDGGVLRRCIAAAGDVLPVGGLLGIIAAAEVSDDEIDALVTDFKAHFVPAAEAGADAAASPEQVDVAGQTIRYLRRGGGDANAILIHGFGGDLNNWLFNHEVLASDRAVYAIDLPGHGGSSKTVDTGTVAEFADVVERFMAALELGPVHLVGHSLGGAVAMELARRSDNRVRSLALLASAGLGAEIDSDYIDGFASASRRKEMKRQVQKLFADTAKVPRQLVEDLLKYKRLDGVEAALRKIASAFSADGKQTNLLREVLEQLAVPTLVVWGEQDAIVPAAHASDLPDHVETQIIDGKGHLIQMDAANEVNRAISALWARAEGL